MPDYGLFEASQMACPVLPQYHPKQLMELLNSGKIRWVKAILAHLVRFVYICHFFLYIARHKDRLYITSEYDKLTIIILGLMLTISLAVRNRKDLYLNTICTSGTKY